VAVAADKSARAKTGPVEQIQARRQTLPICTLFLFFFSGRQSRNESSAAESPQTPRMASTLSNGRESRLPPAAQPLHYSPFEMGTGHPLVFSGSPHLGGDWPMSPKLSAKRRPVVEARQRISLSQLELALRGGQQPEPVTVWSSTASSSPPLSSSLSPSPLLPPKPTAPSSREQRGPSPPILKSARREWQGQKQQQAAEEEGRSASPQYFRRVQSPRPEVHFQQRVVPLGHSPLEYAQVILGETGSSIHWGYSLAIALLLCMRSIGGEALEDM
jgi:hypothetical protein